MAYVRHGNRAKFFGYDSVAIDAHQVNVATVEKTLVECADHST
jgi:predicted transcriptional regulator of viral defense system